MKRSTTIALPLALLSALASAKDVTFRPAGNQEEWNGWTESAFAASFVDGHLPAAGDIVTLSPACSSFDLFKNFEERGNTFRAIVESLQ